MKQKNPPLPLPGPVNSSWHVGIIHSSYYKEEVDALVSGAERTLREAGILPGSIRTFSVPGSFEIPLLGEALARTKEVDALIGLGIVVQGETHHAALVAGEAARGIMDVQLRHGIPFAFEILSVDRLELARARLDRGEEAARSVLHSLAQLARIRG
ncbi:MAG: 6,7-dimethyl-8-ribityllumazine synthase [Candidatus Peribacteraceae bacterium]|jgi:6,7-dimethyl-8-ribityllumazine synthase